MGTEIVGPEREQPQSDRVWSIETNGINAIPDAERHGRPIELFWIWFAANISILGMFYGLALVTFYGLDLTQALAAGVLGTVISFTLVGLISLAGKRGGAPTLTLSRAPFGVVGNALPTVVSYLALVGWETILVALASLAAQAILERVGVGGGTVSLAIAFAVVAPLTIVTKAQNVPAIGVLPILGGPVLAGRPGHGRARGERQINFAEPRSGLEPKRGRGIAQRQRNVLQSSGRVSNDRQQSVKKERNDRGRRADPEKRNGHEEREQGERRNGLDHSDDGENAVPERAAAAGGDA